MSVNGIWINYNWILYVIKLLQILFIAKMKALIRVNYVNVYQTLCFSWLCAAPTALHLLFKNPNRPFSRAVIMHFHSYKHCNLPNFIIFSAFLLMYIYNTILCVILSWH